MARVRADQRARLDALLEAAGVEDERQLPGPARVALGLLAGNPRADALVPGVCDALEVARAVGRIEGARDALAAAQRARDERLHHRRGTDER